MTFWRCALHLWQLQRKDNSANQIAMQQPLIISPSFCSEILLQYLQISKPRNLFDWDTLSLTPVLPILFYPFPVNSHLFNSEFDIVPAHVSVSKYKCSLQKETISVYLYSGFQITNYFRHQLHQNRSLRTRYWGDALKRVTIIPHHRVLL